MTAPLRARLVQFTNIRTSCTLRKVVRPRVDLHLLVTLVENSLLGHDFLVVIDWRYAGRKVSLR